MTVRAQGGEYVLHHTERTIEVNGVPKMTSAFELQVPLKDLAAAIKAGNDKKTKKLLEKKHAPSVSELNKGSGLSKEKGKEHGNMPAIILAVLCGRLSVLNRLLIRTPAGRLVAVKLLLDAKVDVNAQSHLGFTAMQ